MITRSSRHPQFMNKSLCYLCLSCSVWMPELAVMDLGRQLCVKMKKQRKAEMTIPTAMKGLEIHFYLSDTHQLEFFKDCYTAEDLCVEAAKRCRKCLDTSLFRAPIDCQPLMHLSGHGVWSWWPDFLAVMHRFITWWKWLSKQSSSYVLHSK